MKKAKIAVLISGNGSNLQALIDACRVPDYPGEIALVISNKAEAYGLTRAAQAGIESLVIDHRAHESREDFDAALDAALTARGTELVCLAGFMRLLSGAFVRKWHGRLLNIHPSLLPKFKGAHAIRDALAAGEKETGCTVHHVVEAMDAGPVIAQARVPILPGDDEAALAARVHAAEHKLYPAALKYVMTGDDNKEQEG